MLLLRAFVRRFGSFGTNAIRDSYFVRFFGVWLYTRIGTQECPGVHRPGSERGRRAYTGGVHRHEEEEDQSSGKSGGKGKRGDTHCCCGAGETEFYNLTICPVRSLATLLRFETVHSVLVHVGEPLLTFLFGCSWPTPVRLVGT